MQPIIKAVKESGDKILSNFISFWAPILAFLNPDPYFPYDPDPDPYWQYRIANRDSDPGQSKWCLEREKI